MNKRVIFFIALVLMTIVTLFSIAKVRSYILSDQEHILSMQANQAALLVNGDDLKKLEYKLTDLEKPEYKNIREKLVNFRLLNKEARFLYVLGFNTEKQKQFFMIDSEEVSSKDFSPPGQIYEDAQPQDIENYIKGISYTKGPYNDAWGNWVSGYAPIKDSFGNVVGFLGIDISTEIWKKQTIFSTTLLLVVGSLLAILISFLMASIFKKQSSIESLEKQTDFLTKKEQQLKDIQTLARIGKFMLFLPEKVFSFDEQLSSVFKTSIGERMTLNSFLGFIDNDDSQKVIDMIKEIEAGSVVYSWVDVRIGNHEEGFLPYRIYGTVEKESMDRKVFSGVIQEKDIIG